MLGSHFIKSYAKTQSSVTLSSGEAEITAMLKAGSEAIGIFEVARDLGMPLEFGRMFVDAAAAIGIAQREGLGRVRHVDVGILWLQQRVLREQLEIRKVDGKTNPADGMTKHVTSKAMRSYEAQLGMEARAGRGDQATRVHKGA